MKELPRIKVRFDRLRPEETGMWLVRVDKLLDSPFADIEHRRRCFRALVHQFLAGELVPRNYVSVTLFLEGCCVERRRTVGSSTDRS